MVGEEQGRQRPLHVPTHVAGEHAEEDVGPHPVVEPVADGAHLQGELFHDPERLLELGEILVGRTTSWAPSSSSETLVRIT